jgi:flagellar hook-basal body complex protein FliE
LKISAAMRAVQAQRPLTSLTEASKKTAVQDFSGMLHDGLNKVNDELGKADGEVTNMLESEGANLHETVIAMERADLALKLSVKVGEKLVQAYREISKMQI